VDSFQADRSPKRVYRTAPRQIMQLVAEHRPDVVIMDLCMGDERPVTVPQIKSCWNGNKLLAISLWTDDETKAPAESIGTVRFLDKTKLADQLIAAARQCCKE
jgi:DNA-binding NarL/FixJ family response regulator